MTAISMGSIQLTSIFTLAIFMAMCCTACNSQDKHVETAVQQDTVLKGNFSAATEIAFDSLLIDTFLQSHPDFQQFEADLKKLYRIQKFSYVWYDKHGVPEATNNLINHLQAQQSDGILKNINYPEEFTKIVSELRSGKIQQPSPRIELMLTAQYFDYAKNVWGGAQVDRAEDMGWYLPKKRLNYTDLLQQQLKDPTTYAGQSAVVPQYLALKEQLNRYQKLAQQGPDVLVTFHAKLKNLLADDTSAIVPLIRKRLYQLGDLSDTSSSNHYDPLLQQAVVQFKERHGIKPSSALTSDFITELNVPIRKRIEQMIVNLERMRWVPVDDHGGEFILVNIPEYKLHYYVGNKLDWDCKVVVGKVMTKTVIFSGHLQHIVFSPYWYVPESIIEKEIKPGMARNPNYLAQQRMEWNGGHVRQKPGDRNSLGLVKFIFPNSNNIYLHDTPSKPLFEEDNRAFSHGCIRVSKPRELAIRILKQLPSWTPEKIDRAMHAGNEQTVVLQRKIPVYIGYFTSFVNSKGLLNFRADVYQRDSRLLNSLMKK